MPSDLATTARAALDRCGAQLGGGDGPSVTARSPITGEDLFAVPALDAAGVEDAIGRAEAAFLEWRTVPAPVRGALVKRYGSLLGEHLEDLADLVQIEVGKIRAEARGEVQELSLIHI